jgi:EmrB/QacA subfamily drug resistance transporter
VGWVQRHRQQVTLAAMSGVLAVALLDETVVGVALPTIQRDLDMSVGFSHWVVNAYLLSLSAVVLIGGRLGDAFGHLRLFVLGCLTFGLASLVCGLAPDGITIVAARAVEGLGAAIILPSSMAMISLVYPPERLGWAYGIYGGVGTAALAAGPLIGGFFTDVVTWRVIFFVNLPLIVLVIAGAVAAWREPDLEGPRPSLDFAGLGLVAAGICTLVIAIMQGPAWGWGSPRTIGLLAVAVVATAALIAVELRKRDPLIDVRLFRTPTFTGSNFVILTAQATKMGVTIFGALYLQQSLDLDPLDAGLALLPGVGVMPFAAVLAGRITDRFGNRGPSLVGTAGMAVALAWIGVFAGADSYPILIPGLVLWGLVLPLLYTPPQTAVMQCVPPAAQGQAGGISLTAQLMGGTIGVAVLSALLIDTNDFQVLFLVAAALALVACISTWLLVDRHPERARAVASVR